MSSERVGGWESEAVSRNVLVLKHKTATTSISEPAPLLLVGDCHWDNPDCDRDKLAFDLNQALEYDSPILIGGDFFCAMQGNFDKRKSKAKLREEHQTGDYFDSLITTAAEWLEPWKDNIMLICPGNHESSILKYHETNLTMRLVAELKRMGSPAESGGYAGWVKFSIKDGTSYFRFDMHYHHGYGGGGPVTKGKIDFNRYRDQANYDIMWSQHVHHTEIFDTRVVYLSSKDKVRHKALWHVRTPSYKDEYNDGHGGFQIERGQGPRPTGGAWLTFYPVEGMSRTSNRYAIHIERTRE